MEKILWELAASGPSSFHVDKFRSPAGQRPDLYTQAVSAATSTEGSLNRLNRTEVLAPAYGASCTSLLMYWGIALGSLKRLHIDSLMRNGPAFMAFHAIAW